MNPINQLVKQSGFTRRQILELTGIGHNTLDRLLARHKEPDAQLATIRRLAGALGYRLVISFEPIGKE